MSARYQEQRRMREGARNSSLPQYDPNNHPLSIARSLSHQHPAGGVTTAYGATPQPHSGVQGFNDNEPHDPYSMPRQPFATDRRNLSQIRPSWSPDYDVPFRRAASTHGHGHENVPPRQEFGYPRPLQYPMSSSDLTHMHHFMTPPRNDYNPLLSESQAGRSGREDRDQYMDRMIYESVMMGAASGVPHSDLGSYGSRVRAYPAALTDRSGVSQERDALVGLDREGTDRPTKEASEDDKWIRMECKVCFCQVANTVLLPCGHCVMCRWCADELFIGHPRDSTVVNRLAKCPVCRSKVKSKHMIYGGDQEGKRKGKDKNKHQAQDANPDGNPGDPDDGPSNESASVAA